MSQQVNVEHTAGGRKGDVERMHRDKAEELVRSGKAKFISRVAYKTAMGMPLTEAQKRQK